MSEQVQPKYLTLVDARTYCGLPKRTLKRAIKAGHVRSLNRGRRLIDRESLEAWIVSSPACGINRVITPRRLTRKEVRQHTGLTLSTIDLHIKAKRFKTEMVGGRKLVDRTSFDE